jgi:formiminoglutamase
MDLNLVFDKVADLGSSDDFAYDSLYKSVRFNTGKHPDLKKTDIVIIGISNPINEDKEVASSLNNADTIRKKLYRLKRTGSSYRIVDLGNIRNGIDILETKLRLTQTLSHLHEEGVLPIVIGASHDFDYAQYQSYELSDKLVSILNVDALLDIDDRADAHAEQNHVHKIMLHEPNYLFNYIHLGYQSYLVSRQSVEVLEKLSFNAIRLGQLRDKPLELEPTIREADMLSFDLSAIQKHIMSAVSTPNVFGLTGEEACQLCWYAGSNEKLSSVGFYGYQADLDDKENSSAFVVATMIWYFIEGYYNRKDKHDFTDKYYTKYLVPIDKKSPAEIVFYKSKKTEKWWLEVPLEEMKGNYHRNFIVPCSYEDYITAGKGELPERWINAFSRLV